MWRALTETDLKQVISGQELADYRTELIVDGDADPVAGLIEKVTAEFRNAIRSFASNQLHNDATYLPEAGIRHACVKIRHAILTRSDVVAQTMSEARRDEYKDAKDWLADVKAGRELIEQPYATESTPAALPSIMISNNKPGWDQWRNQDG